LAKTEIVREGGREKTQIVKVFENRLAPLLVNVLILVCLPIIWELRVMPTCVISDALFLFMGLTGLPGNDLWERFKLLFTDTSLYPPLPHSQADVPNSCMHIFTLVQTTCVVVLYAVSRSPIAVAFPVFLVLTIPVKLLIPKLTCGRLTDDMVAILNCETRSEVSGILSDVEVAKSPEDGKVEKVADGECVDEAKVPQERQAVGATDGRVDASGHGSNLRVTAETAETAASGTNESSRSRDVRDAFESI